MFIKAPYNFVPLAKHVVQPSWANLVNHEKPFTDSQSGQLNLTIEAVQPIFTRNSVSRLKTNDKERKELGSHFNSAPDNQFFLPGSSIKGAIRNVLEILSFGDLSKGLNNDPWALRDLDIENYKKVVLSDIRCGWLKSTENDTYFIDDCGAPKRITHQQIDDQLGFPIFKNWVAGFKNEKGQKLNIKTGTVANKRRLFNSQLRVLKEKQQWFDEKGEIVEATLVLTGQPSIKYAQNGKGTLQVNYGDSIKYKEFLFPKTIRILKVNEQVIKNFRFAHPDEKLNSLPIPVFFHTTLEKNEDGNEEEVVSSFGLAYMYKIPFTYSVKEAIGNHQDAGNGPDMAACIFGHVERNGALRGRVSFGHAFAQGAPQEMDLKKEVLNSPKATYYPTYIRQKINKKGEIEQGKYKTLFDKDAVPSGWKRYPIHQDNVKPNSGPMGRDNSNIQTHFRPLPAGTVFTGSVNYHNLKKIELGALLSALSFHLTPDCYHSLGMAKPLGYGKCSIRIDGIDEELKKECLCQFEEYMEDQLQGGWLRSDQLLELLTISSNQENVMNSLLEYMSLLDHASAKKNKEALNCYTKLDGIVAKHPNTVGNKETLKEEDKKDTTDTLETRFEKRKQDLMQAVERKRQERKNKEKIEQEAAEQRRIGEEKERQLKELQAEKARKEQAEKEKQLTEGINLNGVLANKPIDSLNRVLKRWKEVLAGEIADAEIAAINKRLSDLYVSVKQNQKDTWLQQVKTGLPQLSIFLTNEQIKAVEDHLKSF